MAFWIVFRKISDRFSVGQPGLCVLMPAGFPEKLRFKVSIWHMAGKKDQSVVLRAGWPIQLLQTRRDTSCFTVRQQWHGMGVPSDCLPSHLPKRHRSQAGPWT